MFCLLFWFVQINKWWNEQNDGVKVFAGIALINGLVFLAWKVPSLQSFMVRYFASAPTGSMIINFVFILFYFITISHRITALSSHDSISFQSQKFCSSQYQHVGFVFTDIISSIWFWKGTVFSLLFKFRWVRLFLTKFKLAKYHFILGVVSSFTSYLHKIITKTYPLSLGAVNIC